MVSAADKREGRGRLSSIDMLPDEAEPALVWALEQLRERKLPSAVILTEFNERLADIANDNQIEIKPISKSAWGRYAVRKATLYRQQDETRRIASELAASMGAKDADEMTVMIAEMVKIAAFELLEDGQLSSKGIMEISRALQSSVGAQMKSREYRERLEIELNKGADRVEKAASEAGLSADVIAQMRRDFLGVREGKPE